MMAALEQIEVIVYELVSRLEEVVDALRDDESNPLDVARDVEVLLRDVRGVWGTLDDLTGLYLRSLEDAEADEAGDAVMELFAGLLDAVDALQRLGDLLGDLEPTVEAAERARDVLETAAMKLRR